MTVITSEDLISIRKKIKSRSDKIFCVETVKQCLPILNWLPDYNCTTLIHDLIAGVTVGLTAISQGMGYAAIAGLPTEYGLYAGMMGGFVYLFFGGCKDVAVGPTAIMSALVARYIAGYNADFAVLAAFLSGVIELLMGIVRLGFLVQFISRPVISGFTNAAALQISSGQLKALFGYSGTSGNYFAESVSSFIKNIRTINVWDTALGFSTIVTLIILQKIGQGCHLESNFIKKIRWYISRSRNTIVVVLGIVITFLIKITISMEPVTVVGEIPSGIPKFELPPFSSVVGNETFDFSQMVVALGPQSLILPIVSILEIIAIASAFSGGATIDASQEMIALGLCNIIGSFVGGMPVTGSFSRAALNHASGARTPTAGAVTGILIILALSLLTSTFYYIPKATLAGLIITAMYSMINWSIIPKLWKTCKKELLITLITMIVCLSAGLEYGIMTGILMQAATLLYDNSSPKLKTETFRNANNGVTVIIALTDSLSYCAVDLVRCQILQASRDADVNSIVIDCVNLRRIDYTIALNLVSIATDLEKQSILVIFSNFSVDMKNKCVSIDPKSIHRFKTGLIEPLRF